ncbi:MAG: phosphate permease [Elusimicrobia bacterium]|nr:MAG: phosphate permease [Elusimicrobiota bacterium]
MTLIVLFAATCFLAYSNGANDNFKGVATLFGSGTMDYKKALRLATATTIAGSMASIFFAQSLLKTFSGKGLVPPSLAGSPEFLLAVALGAGLTVMLATVIGFPISTTHGLTGALVGAGLMAVGTEVNISVLGSKFFLPLLVSPFLALLMAALLYSLFRYIRINLGIGKEWCACVGEVETVTPIPQPGPTLSLSVIRTVDPTIDSKENCIQRYSGTFVGVNTQTMVDAAHYTSAGLVCFARGLNDTPKIVALLLVIQAFSIQWGMAAVGFAMALGGLLHARKVAEKMSKKITPLNHGQGFSANVVTAFLVIVASRMGVPVSTTHVSVGSLFGIGGVTGQADTRVVRDILMSWFLTLPIAAAFSAAAYLTAASLG